MPDTIQGSTQVRTGFPDLIASVLLAIAALVVRMPRMRYGVTTDELALVEHNNPAWFVWGRESGINPPLFPLLINVFAPERSAVDVGRTLSLAAGVATVVLVYLITRRAAESRVAAVLAALVLVFHPSAVAISTEFRAYGAFLFVFVLGQWGLSSWRADAPPCARFGAALATALFALLLPQLHYIGIPVVVLTAASVLVVRDDRPLLKFFVPGTLGMVPLIGLIFRMADARTRDPGGLKNTLLTVLSLDLTIPGAGPPAFVLWLANNSPRDADRLALAVGTTLTLALAAVRWRTLSAAARFALRFSLIALIASVAAGIAQRLRTPVAMIFLTPASVLFFSLPSIVPNRLTRVLTRGASAAVVAWLLHDRVGRESGSEDRNAMRDFAANWRALDAVRAGRPFVILQGSTHPVLHYYAVGRAWGPVAPATACPDDPDCFVYDGATFRSLEGWPSPVPDGLAVSFALVPTEGAPGCVLIRERWPAVWDCKPPDSP